MIVETIKKNRWLLLILALAFGVRLATALWFGDTMEVIPAGGTYDQVTYDTLGHRFSEGHGFSFPSRWYPYIQPDTPTSYFSSSMSLLLGLIYTIFGYHPLVARILFAIFGTLICYYIYRLGKRLFNERVGLIAALIGAGYAYLILYSAVLITETPFTLFLLITFDLSYSIVEEEATTKRFIYLGLALAGAVLFRMAVFPFVIVLLPWLYLATRKASRPVALRQLLIPILLIILFIIPWTIRNYNNFDRFLLLQSQFGHVFWNANHPDQGNFFAEVAWVAPIPEELVGMNEVDIGNELMRRGIENIVSDPIRYIQLSLSRALTFFRFWPTGDSSLLSNASRVLSFGVTVPFMIYGLIVSKNHWRRLLPIYLFLLAHWGIHLASWVMIRYRIPADAVLLPFAGLAIATLLARVAPAKQPEPAASLP